MLVELLYGVSTVTLNNKSHWLQHTAPAGLGGEPCLALRDCFVELDRFYHARNILKAKKNPEILLIPQGMRYTPMAAAGHIKTTALGIVQPQHISDVAICFELRLDQLGPNLAKLCKVLHSMANLLDPKQICWFYQL